MKIRPLVFLIGNLRFAHSYNISVDCYRGTGLLVVALVASFARAQQTDGAATRQASHPADLLLTLQTSDGHQRFNLGEPVSVALLFSSTTPGRYFFLRKPEKLEGGKADKVSCEPTANIRDLMHPARAVDISTFLEAGDECEIGVGRGGTSYCGDCDGEVRLGEAPVRLEWDLNANLKFLRPGRYECTATAAEVTEDPPGATTRRALALVSQPVVFDVVENPQWARLTLAKTIKEISRLHCTQSNSDPAKAASSDFHCMQLLNDLEDLDTEDSLREAVRLYDGLSRPPGGSELWRTITQSQHEHLAFQLMEKKLEQADFGPSRGSVDWIANAALFEQTPGAFEENVDPAVYHDEAIEVLRKYVRVLGRAMPNKRGTALSDSREVYQYYAQMQFCHLEPLISEEEMNSVLAAAKPSR